MSVYEREEREEDDDEEEEDDSDDCAKASERVLCINSMNDIDSSALNSHICDHSKCTRTERETSDMSERVQ
jgi:hypothetical protein